MPSHDFPFSRLLDVCCLIAYILEQYLELLRLEQNSVYLYVHFYMLLLWDSGFGVLRSRGGIWLQNKLQWMWQDTFLCSCNIAHESLFYRFLEEDCWKCISMFVLPLPFLLVLLFANSGKFSTVSQPIAVSIKVSTWMKMSRVVVQIRNGLENLQLCIVSLISELREVPLY